MLSALLHIRRSSSQAYASGGRSSSRQVESTVKRDQDIQVGRLDCAGQEQRAADQQRVLHARAVELDLLSARKAACGVRERVLDYRSRYARHAGSAS